MGCCGDKTADEGLEMNENGEKKSAGKYGSPRKHDPNFNGPIKNRSCTDVICCIIFVLYIIGMGVVGFISFAWGNPVKLLNPTDSEGNVCGSGSMKDRPNLLFFDLTQCVPTDVSKVFSITSCPTYQVCVKSCPTKNQAAVFANTSDLICKYKTDLTGVDTYQEKYDLIFNKKECAPYTLQSSAVLKRCIPTVIGDSIKKFLSPSGNELTDANNKTLTGTNVRWGTIAASVLVNLQNLGKRLIQDVQSSWYWILSGLGIAMVASFMYILIIRWVAGIFVWLTTYAVLTLFGFGTYYCYTEYDRLKNSPTSNVRFEFTTNLASYKDMKETWLALTIICGVTLGILILLLRALRNRIRLAIQLIKESSRAITAMISTLFFPIVPWILQMILFAWFVVVLTYLVTAGQADYRVVNNGTVSTALCDSVKAAQKVIDSFNSTCNFIEYKNNDNLFRMQVYHLFGWFWLMNFIIAFGQCCLAGAFASWYWAWDKKTDVPTLPLLSSMGRTLRYHTGSLAFGSLIIALIQLIRAGLEYLDHKLNGPGQNPGPVVKFLIKCLKCCFWCLEKFLKFLNKNAYIEIAVYGKNFCVSAKNAFFLLMRNILRVAVLDKVTDFLLFLGKLVITAGMAVGSFYWFERQENLNYYLAPVFIITIGSYMIASAFFGVFEMAIDTIFLSFLEDSERHDGSPNKPYFMSKKLQKLLGKKNKKNSDDDD